MSPEKEREDKHHNIKAKGRSIVSNYKYLFYLTSALLVEFAQKTPENHTGKPDLGPAIGSRHILFCLRTYPTIQSN
ncbi:hypothetical protein VN97_g2669 [Penicillium thymicola]|uniref:Uncharacterized protein n=1 Tax=Penicillium thymicola TaxID=293382 RepID=A0AAI9XC05_PENTH|nr:hypothetical protein VN97_g2669 [Penicillium thymicola]